jgi:hypothetical protein
VSVARRNLKVGQLLSRRTGPQFKFFGREKAYFVEFIYQLLAIVINAIFNPIL